MNTDPTQPYQPYPYQQSPYQPYQQPQKKPNLWQRYRAKSRRAQFGIGCALFVGSLLVCGMCSGVGAAVTNSTASTSPTPTAASNVAITANSPTAEATLAPTPTKKPTPKPTAKPTAKPKPTQPKPTGVNGNPWGYNFTPGNLIYSPPAAFCDYFNCIASFWNGSGFVNECADATYSKSGGIRGDCSHHGGELRPLYSH